jgi:hypothetical protein
MALGGVAPVIIFTFYKEISVPQFLQGFVKTAMIPFLPIPIYLDEKFTKVLLDDYDRDTTIDVLRDGVTGFERTSADAVTLKFRANKSNIAITTLTALIDKIVGGHVDKKTYSITIFYDNIFIIGAALEQFSTRLMEGGDMREISMRVANRPKAPVVAGTPITNVVGTAKGILGG